MTYIYKFFLWLDNKNIKGEIILKKYKRKFTVYINVNERKKENIEVKSILA